MAFLNMVQHKKNEFERLLKHGAAELSIPISDKWIAGFFTHFQELEIWNKKINLTRIIDVKGVVTRHFLDSLVLLPVLDGVKNLLDVGSGAGFPGLVLAIAVPDLDVHLVESVGKKAHFLSHVRRVLGLENVTVHHARVEKLPEDLRFEMVTGRAVASPRHFAQTVAGRFAPKGKLALFLSTTNIPPVDGWELSQQVDYTLPLGGPKRTVALFSPTGLATAS